MPLLIPVSIDEYLDYIASVKLNTNSNPAFHIYTVHVSYGERVNLEKQFQVSTVSL